MSPSTLLALVWLRRVVMVLLPVYVGALLSSWTTVLPQDVADGLLLLHLPAIGCFGLTLLLALTSKIDVRGLLVAPGNRHWTVALFTASNVGALGMMTKLGQGSPSRHGDGYALLNHGDVVRVISEAEFLQATTDQVAAFSCLWVAFGFASFAVLTVVLRDVTARV